MNFSFLLKSREMLLGIVIIILLLLVGSINSDFLRADSLISAFNDTSILIILAMGQMLVILTRCIDLSVAANIAFTGMIIALVNTYYPDFPIILLMLLAMIIGALLGAINGLFVWLLGIPSIVVTLGTMSIYRGLTFLLTNGEWVNSHQMSKSFIDLPRTIFLGFPILSWIAIFFAIVMFLALKYSQWGRRFFTAGGNPTAAFYTGIDVGRVQFNSFMVSGLLAGLCGYLWVSRFAVAYVDVANGFELQVVAACVIGGISIMGGTGSVIGCLLGAIFIGIVNNALPIIGVSPFWQMAISGFVIIVAVIANSRSERTQGRQILRKITAADISQSPLNTQSKEA